MTRRRMPKIGTTKAQNTARISCLGVLIGPSCGPSFSFGSCAAVIDSSGQCLRREEAACAAQKAIRAEPEIIGRAPPGLRGEGRLPRGRRVECGPAASVAQWIEYCP